MPGPTLDGGPEAIGFLLVPGFSMMGFFSAVEPLRVANRLAGAELFAWRAYSIDGQPVDASNGMRLVVEGALGGIAAGPMLLICAGFEPLRHAGPAVLRHLKRLARCGTVLGGIDTGAFLLAQARLLEGVAVTAHWEALAAFREAFPHLATTERLFQIEPGRITCAGGTAAMDLMLELIGNRHGPGLASAVSDQLIHNQIRDPKDMQRHDTSMRRGAPEGRLDKVLALMERHLDNPLPKLRLAASCGLSVRQLERLFRAQLQRSPAEHYLELRLTRARHLLRQSELSIVEVANAAGFSSASALSRAYRHRFGLPPSRDRKEPSRWGSALSIL